MLNKLFKLLNYRSTGQGKRLYTPPPKIVLMCPFCGRKLVAVEDEACFQCSKRQKNPSIPHGRSSAKDLRKLDTETPADRLCRKSFFEFPHAPDDEELLKDEKRRAIEGQKFEKAW